MSVVLQKGIDPAMFKSLTELYAPMLSSYHLRDRFQFTAYINGYPFPVGIASMSAGTSRFLQFALIPEARGQNLSHEILDELIKLTGATRIDWGCKRLNYPSLKLLQERNGGLLEGSVSHRNGKSYEGFFRVSGGVSSKMQGALTRVLPQAREQYVEWVKDNYEPRRYERLSLKRYLFGYIDAIDSHFHLHPEASFGHLHSVGHRFRCFISPDNLIASMDKDGLSKAIIFGLPSDEGNTRLVNDLIFQYCSYSPTRLIPFAILDDNLNVSQAAKKGFRGFKEHVYAQRILRGRNGKEALATNKRKRLYAAVAEHQLPLITHMGPNVVARVEDILRSSPQLTLIIAHLGASFSVPIAWNEVREILVALCQHPNVYFDVSAITDINIIEKSIDTVGCKKLIWGSDWPLEPHSNSIERFLSSDKISIFDLYALFHGNIELILQKCRQV